MSYLPTLATPVHPSRTLRPFRQIAKHYGVMFDDVVALPVVCNEKQEPRRLRGAARRYAADAMGGPCSRRKSVRVELAIAKLIVARKVSRAYQAHHDLELPLGADRMLRIERKARAYGYDWLNDRDVLIGKADRQEPLVVVRMSLAAEIAKATTGTCTECDKGRAA